MASRKTSEKRDRMAYPPTEVDVTVIPGPRGRTIEERLPTIRVPAAVRAVVAVVLALAAIGAAFALRGGGRPGGFSDARATQTTPPLPTAGARLAGAAGVAAAYRYPLACLSVMISSSDPVYASARLDRASPCWRYGVWVVAVFRRVDGAWRLVLQAHNPSCSGISLPPAVKTQLAVCQQAAPRPSTRARGDRLA